MNRKLRRRARRKGPEESAVESMAGTLFDIWSDRQGADRRFDDLDAGSRRDLIFAVCKAVQSLPHAVVTDRNATERVNISSARNALVYEHDRRVATREDLARRQRRIERRREACHTMST